MEQTSHSSYDLVMFQNGSWALISSNKVLFHGNFKKVVRAMVNRFGFELEEIEIAVESMENQADERSHFGIQRKFIFSYSQYKLTGAA
jgi:hypothetical protein